MLVGKESNSKSYRSREMQHELYYQKKKDDRFKSNVQAIDFRMRTAAAGTYKIVYRDRARFFPQTFFFSFCSPFFVFRGCRNGRRKTRKMLLMMIIYSFYIHKDWQYNAVFREECELSLC